MNPLHVIEWLGIFLLIAAAVNVTILVVAAVVIAIRTANRANR